MFGKNKKNNSNPSKAQYISIPAGTVFNGGINAKKPRFFGRTTIMSFSVISQKRERINYN